MDNNKERIKIIADNIKKLIRERGITQKKLAEEIGISPNNITEWMSLRSAPSLKTLEILARYFEIKPSELIDSNYQIVEDYLINSPNNNENLKNQNRLKERIKMKEQEPISYKGQISISKLNGGEKSLYGSKISHNTTIRLDIKTSEESRDLGVNKYHSGRNLMQLEMSPTQFSELITSIGMGDGIPVTIRRFNGEEMNPPRKYNIEKVLKSDITKANEKMEERLEKIKDTIKNKIESGKPMTIKQLKELEWKLSIATNQVQEDKEFYFEQAEKELDSMIHQAHQEVEANIQSKLNSIAIKSIGTTLDSEMKKRNSLSGNHFKIAPEYRTKNKIKTDIENMIGQHPALNLEELEALYALSNFIDNFGIPEENLSNLEARGDWLTDFCDVYKQKKEFTLEGREIYISEILNSLQT